MYHPDRNIVASHATVVDQPAIGLSCAHHLNAPISDSALTICSYVGDFIDAVGISIEWQEPSHFHAIVRFYNDDGQAYLVLTLSLMAREAFFTIAHTNLDCRIISCSDLMSAIRRDPSIVSVDAKHPTAF